MDTQYRPTGSAARALATPAAAAFCLARRRPQMALFALGLAGLSAAAVGHVRWFTRVAESHAIPVGPGTLIASPTFLMLLAATLGVMALVQRVDRWLVQRGNVVARLAQRTQPSMTRAAALLVRIGLALYLAGLALLFADAPVTLAPDLHAPGAWIAPHQLLLAACFLSRRTVVAGCAGLLALFAFSVHQFGWVRMVDYHFFLGVCAFLVLDGTDAPRWRRIGLAIFRLTVATSFMWVGIEKWIHPAWTQDVLQHRLPVLLLGQSPEFVAMAAGFVEVALAFLILLGGVSAQLGAIALMLLVSSAIPLAGVVDAAGHVAMLFFLLVLAGTGNGLAGLVQRVVPADALGAVCRFTIVVAGVTGLYFLAHSLGAGRGRAPDWPQLRIALAWAAVLAVWLAHLVYACRQPLRGPAPASRSRIAPG
ncbi:MAG TPA: hypothetical protein VFM98_04520 [Ramlibacter sp.]|uniref:hypothetical protein n=1 Tax=Ramlibacter sp. TaxID=1917967 RepID=UPI002D7EA1AE|nr:hypothetical protein [Ramlibacter sp.]HET8744842.1 hypothetical protein [Ramlibacter sp.]